MSLQAPFLLTIQVLVPGQALLDLQLPCVVEEGSAKAKWAKARKELVITMVKK